MKNDSRIYTAITLDFETGGRDCLNTACTQLAMTAIRLDNLSVVDSYCKYILPYCKIEGDKGKRLRKRNEADVNEQVLMGYEQDALDFTGITMDALFYGC